MTMEIETVDGGLYTLRGPLVAGVAAAVAVAAAGAASLVAPAAAAVAAASLVAPATAPAAAGINETKLNMDPWCRHYFLSSCSFNYTATHSVE
jgi:hypothetical protein